MAKQQTTHGGDRPEYDAICVQVLHVAACHYDTADGEPAVVLTISRGQGEEIEPLVFDQRDARFMATNLLVALAANGNAFAENLLNDRFEADRAGDFCWPREEQE